MREFPRLVALVLLLAVPACKKQPGHLIERAVDRVSDRIVERFANDEQALAIAARFLSPSPAILEAGSYHGETAVAMVQRWPGATIYSFEPVPELFEIAKKNTSAWRNIHLSELALSDKVGTAIFHLSALEENPDASVGSGSLLEPSHHLEGFPFIKFDKTIAVTTTTIDQWASVNQVNRLDFIWLDIQGLEFPVLKASPSILKTVRVIMAEVEFVELYKGQSLYAEIRPWLEAQGFAEVATDFAPEAPQRADLKMKKAISWYGNSIFARK